MSTSRETPCILFIPRYTLLLQKLIVTVLGKKFFVKFKFPVVVTIMLSSNVWCCIDTYIGLMRYGGTWYFHFQCTRVSCVTCRWARQFYRIKSLHLSVYPVTREVLSDTTQVKAFEIARRCWTTVELLVHSVSVSKRCTLKLETKRCCETLVPV